MGRQQQLTGFEIDEQTGRKYLVSYLGNQPERITVLGGQDTVLVVTLEQSFDQMYGGEVGCPATLRHHAIFHHQWYPKVGRATRHAMWVCRQAVVKMEPELEREPIPLEFGGSLPSYQAATGELRRCYEAASASFAGLVGSEVGWIDDVVPIVKGAVRSAARDFLASPNDPQYKVRCWIEDNYDLTCQVKVYSPD